VLVYALPSTGIPWPVGIAIALAPIAAGLLLIHRLAASGAHGPDGLRVITGILAFFIVLDVLAGLGGRYDLIAGALATTLALRWLGRRDQRAQVPAELTGGTANDPHIGTTARTRARLATLIDSA
jgi:hypothetical protein